LGKTFFQDLKPSKHEDGDVQERIIKNMSKSASDRKKADQLLDRIKSESDQTLFLIIVDEAHTSPIESCLTDRVVNDPHTIAAKNCVVLVLTNNSIISNFKLIIDAQGLRGSAKQHNSRQIFSAGK
jgi:hypothetical protein